MAEDGKAAETKPTVFETDAEEGTPLLIHMPVDVRSIAITTIAVLGTILMLQYARPVLIPIVLAVLISYVLAPAVTSLAKHHVPRVLGAFVIIAILCSALGFGVYTLTDDAIRI